jgi:hypothetical protein
MDFPEEKHEINAVTFGPCGKYVYPSGVCRSTRRFAIRRQHLGLYCGDNENAHSLPWPTGKQWSAPEELREIGLYETWELPDEAFADRGRAPKSRRRGGWDISGPRRAQLNVEINRHDARCMICRNTWFRGERDSRAAFEWLRDAERRGLYLEAVDAIKRMVPKPTPEQPNWYTRLPDDPKLEIMHRFDDSQLRPDHPFSIAFLRAAQKRDPKKFTEGVKRFGVDALAMPVCDACNWGRGARLFESREDILQRWAVYRFQGSVAAAKTHPEHVYFEFLADLAYNTDLVAEVDAATRQRRRKA